MFRWLALFGLLVLALLSCTQADKEENLLTTPAVIRDLDSIKQRGYLTALVDNNSISYFLYRGQPKGYDYELLQQLAQNIKVKVRLKLISGIENGIRKLNAGEGDILAYPLTITEERKNYVLFTNPQFMSHQVLVQRKQHWTADTGETDVNENFINDYKGLAGKSVHVLRHSSFKARLDSLEKELNIDIVIEEDSADAESESLMEKVAKGEIDYTVADEAMASVNLTYYSNLDASLVLSPAQEIAWAVRKNSPNLKQAIDKWLVSMKRKSTFMVIYNRYYRSPRKSQIRGSSKYASIKGDKLSPYDEIIKEAAALIKWDWRLLAAVIYQESRFINQESSWAGARGLMQLMPATAQRFGASNPDDPRQNIRAGVRFFKHLDEYWEKKVQDSTERIKFVLASYNVGLTHIMDARKLAIKYNENPATWAPVEKYLMKKSNPVYYKDPVVIAGYCKCEEPVRYVEEVLNRYEEYKMHIN